MEWSEVQPAVQPAVGEGTQVHPGTKAGFSRCATKLLSCSLQRSWDCATS